MYTDTKRSYEQIIQESITNPQLSSLHLKLRIQKDRLVAWGLEWADSKADQTDDIDISLDRAGISDLVASIMSSIRELVDETERIQPRSRPHLPGGYPVDKAGMLLGTTTQWTPTNLARLEDIVKDITTSIDTLCDLSRSQQIIRQGSTGEKSNPSSHYLGLEKSVQDPLSSMAKPTIRDEFPTAQDQSSLASSTRIDPAHLIYPTRFQQPAATPPSYNSTATDPGNRVFALLKRFRRLEKTASTRDHSQVTPVFVDYYVEDANHSKHGSSSPLKRYEALVLSLQGPHPESENVYTGSLNIIGWFADPGTSRYAFVYEIPRHTISEVPSHHSTANPTQSLLSYLQNSGEVDTLNVPCLEDRFRLALNLVSNILHVHAKGLTHRNINSNNVVFVNENVTQDAQSKPWKEGVIRKPHLVSWDQGVEDTVASEPETLISNIYRHPGIERGQRSKFRPAHDIYSLGLILLEIGLWMPLNKLWKTKYSRSDFKVRLEAIYAKKLSSKCGRAYMGAVEYCLRAVDEYQSARAAGRATSRDRQAKIQNDYYWNVFKPLERCCRMDDSDEPRVMPACSTAAPLELSEVEQRSRARDENPQQLETKDAEAQEAGSIKPAPCDIWTAFSPLLPGNKVETCVWSHCVPNETRRYFDTIMAPKLNKMFAKAIDRWESFEIYVCMTGLSPDLAKPTILMVCKSLAKAWKILEYVNKEKEMFQLYVAPGQITRSKAKKKRTKRSKLAKVEDTPGQQPSRYQQKPTCGASIGCFFDEQHSEAVTFGGVVLVDGEPHGMSVHHMLEDPGDSDVDMAFEGDGSITFPDPGLLFDESFATLDELDISVYDVEEFEEFDMGDFPGTTAGEGNHIIITQPALDDVDPGYFSNEDEMSDDHLVIHGLGTIHASSGLRRLSFDDIAHEVDWALFKLHDDRKTTMNAVDGGIKHCDKASQAFYPSQVLKAEALGDLKVHAFGSTSGLETGKILPTMQLTKMPGRIYASPVWRVKGNFGVGGDSGAWVIDNGTGGVCAHVTAYSEAMQYATIAPMEVLLHDMEQTLGTNIALPSGEQSSCRTFKEQIVNEAGLQTFAIVGKEGSQSHIGMNKYRSLSFEGSDYGSASEHETQSIQGTSPPQSPGLATSPQPLRSMSTLSLNDVADKWECSHKGKRDSVDRNPKDGKALAKTVPVSEGVQAKC